MVPIGFPRAFEKEPGRNRAPPRCVALRGAAVGCEAPRRHTSHTQHRQACVRRSFPQGDPAGADRRIAVRISHLWPLRPGHHHIDLAGPTRGTYEPRFPIEDRDSGTEALGEVRGIGLDLTPACPAPDDQAHAGGRGGALCHRWTGLGFHPRRRRFMMTQWVIIAYLCSPLVAPSPTTCLTYGPYPSEEACRSSSSERSISMAADDAGRRCLTASRRGNTTRR